MRCIVCDADKANYRCRTCRSAYCSSKCYKRHRATRAEAEAATAAAAAATSDATVASSYEHLCEAVMAAQQPEREREEKRQRTEAERDVFSDLFREKAAASAGSSGSAAPANPEGSSATARSPSTEGAAKPAAPPPELAGDADAVYILQEKHLAALANHPRLRSALRSPSLQKLIRTIDSSRSRLDALDAAQYNNADFKEFCDEVMRVIAEVEGR